jgi:cytochrome b6-f complex iron-sulfur subunit
LPVINGTVAGNAVTVNADPNTVLGPVGGAALVRSGAGDFLVAHTALSTFSALTAMCTHEACTITNFNNPTYVCPCHGSQFNTAGQVLSGPATRSLRTYPTQLTSTTLTITI